LQCPHCRTHLTLVPTPTNPVATGDPSPLPPPPVLAREEWTPPPVGEVLAEYAHRSKDTATAQRGAARVRDSFNRARQAATQRRNEQKAARRGAAPEGNSPQGNSPQGKATPGEATPGQGPTGNAASGRASPRAATPGHSGSAFGGAAIRSA
jgi:hypothetical protein